MQAKKILTNKSFCVLPWTGFELEPNGDIKNCIISKTKIGNVQENDIESILSGKENITIKKEMLLDKKPKNCVGCHLQEEDRRSLSSISSRLYYMKELANSVDNKLYDDDKNFSLHHVDLRWSNHCNLACVYCGPEYSSKWATELNKDIGFSAEAKHYVKDYVFKNVKKLKNVYLAGGEPLLINENREFLQLLLERNPMVNIRVNTNLSSTKTGVFELLCKFKNVHWTISVEAIEKEYEYIRYHSDWKKFLTNLKYVKELDHKITFNMLYFILNYKSLFSTVEFFKSLGFHENSFVIGPLYTPRYLNILNLPGALLQKIKKQLDQEIQNSGYLLKNSYENILKYVSQTKWVHDISYFKEQIKILDDRRNQNAQKTFPELFKALQDV